MCASDLRILILKQYPFLFKFGKNDLISYLMAFWEMQEVYVVTKSPSQRASLGHDGETITLFFFCFIIILKHNI